MQTVPFFGFVFMWTQALFGAWIPARTTSIVASVVVALAGLAVGGLSLMWLLRSKGAGKKAGSALGLLVGVGVAAGGIWYGTVGSRFSVEDKVEKREIDEEAEKVLEQFEELLKKCRADVFPAMPYKPSEEAKKDNYEKAIQVLVSELRLCYTGTEEMGFERAVELEQMQWLVENEDCGDFRKRLIDDRAFCPQMVEELIDQAGFIESFGDPGEDSDEDSDESVDTEEESEKSEDSDKGEESDEGEESEKKSDDSDEGEVSDEGGC